MSTVTFALNVNETALVDAHPVRFTGTERLTRPYRFEIDVISQNAELDIGAWIGQPTTLTLLREEDQRHIHGRITEVFEAGRAPGEQYIYRVSLEPRISLLALSRHNRSFGTSAPMSVIDVITAVLTNSDGIALSSDDFEVRPLRLERYPTRDFWVQYEETDLDFLHRLLEHWGLFYYFEQTETHERLVISDSSALSPVQETDGTLTFDDRNENVARAAGVILSVKRNIKAVSKQVYLHDYNEETPQVQLAVSATVSGGTVGTYQEYAAHFADDTEGQLFAQARAEEIGCTRDVFEMTTTSPLQSPGAVFSMEGHFREALNQDYLLIAIEHTGEQYISGAYWSSEASGTPGYRATLTAIPSGTAYRSPRQIKRPVTSGITTARVEAADWYGDRAAIDDQGRYKVSVDFDTADNPIFERSTFVRMAQPYGGTNVGMHLPLPKGTEVMIGWIDGDPDRPLIMGAVPNPLTKSPVTQENRTENRIQTASGISLIMDDGPGTPVAEDPPTDSTAPPSQTSNGATVESPPPPATSQEETPADAPQDTAAASTNGVYTAFVVPAVLGSLPHYLRIGDFAANEPYEKDIIADPLFRKEEMELRDPELPNTQYSGLFSYSPQHRTTTIAGNDTTVIGGNVQMVVGGNSDIKILGRHRIEYSEPGASWLVTKLENPAYSADVYITPKVTYYNTEYLAVRNGLALNYGAGAELRVLASLGGTFIHRVGPKLSLSGFPGTFVSEVPNTLLSQKGWRPYGSSFILSNSGYTFKNIGGIDRSHSIFGAEGGITLGYRGPQTGQISMKKLTEAANNAAVWSMAGGLATELAQGLVIADNFVEGDTQTGLQFAYLGLQTAAILPVAKGYLSAQRTTIDYFNNAAGTEDFLTFPKQADLVKNEDKEPTVTINEKGITLLNGTSSIMLKKDEIVINAEKITLRALQGDKKAEPAPSAAERKHLREMTFTQHALRAYLPELTMQGELCFVGADSVSVKGYKKVDLAGPVNCLEDLAVTGAVQSKKSVSAPKGEFG